jgi:hypothetical protein
MYDFQKLGSSEYSILIIKQLQFQNYDVEPISFIYFNKFVLNLIFYLKLMYDDF